jgi:hypothetical protein
MPTPTLLPLQLPGSPAQQPGGPWKRAAAWFVRSYVVICVAQFVFGLIVGTALVLQ